MLAILVSLAANVLAASLEYAFDANGLTSTAGITELTSTITAGSSSNKISKTYLIKLTASNSIKIKNSFGYNTNSLGYNVAPTKFLYLNENSEARWDKATSKSIPNDFDTSKLQVTEEELKKHGFSASFSDGTLSSDCTYYFFAIYLNGYKEGTNFAFLIQQQGSNAELTDEQKKPLTSLLATVTDKNEASWYQTDDRYNGNGYKSSGFWTAFTAKDGPREQAQKALASAKSPEDIDAARAALQAEIDQLIPTDRLNTTPLYEALQEVNSLGYNDLSLKAYTETSAAKFKEGRAEAQAYLDSLFTGEDGNRKPSDANKKGNQSTLDTEVAKVEALPTLLVHESLVSYSEQNTKTIQALAARYGAGENPGYTEESWSTLQSARTDALAYIKAHPVTDRLTRDENRGLWEKANALWNAICALKSTKEQISVEYAPYCSAGIDYEKAIKIMFNLK